MPDFGTAAKEIQDPDRNVRSEADVKWYEPATYANTTTQC